MQGTQLWSPIFAHVRSKCCNVASLFVGSSSEDESVFELGFWHVQKGICSSLRLHIHKRKKQICCVFVWWVAGLKLRVCLDWGFGKCKRELVQACSSLYLHIHKPKNLPHSVRERFFGLRMCKHKLEQTTFCTCHNLNPNTLSSSKLLPSKQRSTIFFCLWLCKRKLEQIPFCTCHNPNPKTRSSSQLLPTNKECASTPPEAELHKLCFAQCTYSARTVHGTVHATVHGHKRL